MQGAYTAAYERVKDGRKLRNLIPLPSLFCAACGVLVCFLVVATVAGQTPPRGVDPKFAYQYSGSEFHCRDGSATVLAAQVNDDYCDCRDGSDEPGTAACPGATFYCANTGYKPEQISSAWINDGVCDCCDASDEYNGATRCANSCDELGRVYREAQQRALEIREQGYKLRLELASAGRARRAEQRTRVTELEAQLSVQEANVAQAKQLKESAEAPEKQAKDAFDQEREQQKAARTREATDALFRTLDTDADGLLTHAELALRMELDGNEDGQVTTDEIEDILDIDGDGAVNDTEASLSPDMFAAEVYENIKAKFESQKEQEIDEEVKVDADTEEPDADTEKPDPEVKPPYPDNIRELIGIADQARQLHQDTESLKRTTDDELSKLRKALAVDLGSSDEFFGMQGRCYELSEGEYVYEICPFEKVTQKQNSRSTSLGLWEAWASAGDNPQGFMVYSNGEKCWNGPARSCKVELECGVEVKVLSVAEPNRCEYTMRYDCFQGREKGMKNGRLLQLYQLRCPSLQTIGPSRL